MKPGVEKNQKQKRKKGSVMASRPATPTRRAPPEQGKELPSVEVVTPWPKRPVCTPRAERSEFTSEHTRSRKMFNW